MVSKEQIPQELLGGAIFLDSIGCNEFAFTKKDVDKILRYARDNKMAILGGDVIELHNGIYRHTYDNWHTDKFEKQDWEIYVNISICDTQEYINNYPGEDVLFTLSLCDFKRFQSLTL